MTDLWLNNYYRKPPWKIEIFDHIIYKYEAPTYLYNNKHLKDGIDKLFNSDLVKKVGNYTEEQRGKSYSTCSFSKNDLVVNINGMFPLIEWIGCMILDKLKKNQKDIIGYKRIWLNKMFMGCSVICHIHEDPGIDGVAIFYIDVPEDDSGQLIVLKTFIDEEISEKHKSSCFVINVKSGDLIIHDADTPHAVSKHMNKEPRICLVVEFFVP